MKWTRLIIAGAVLLLTVLPLQAQVIVIKLGTIAPEGSPWHTILQDMNQEWGQLSNGRVKIRIYPGGVAGDEVDMLRKIRIGQLHAAGFSSVGLAKIIPEIYALQLPMMYATYGELDYVRDRLTPEYTRMLDEKGFVLLNWADGGWVKLFSQKPVIFPNDLKGQKIFVWAGETTTFAVWKEAGQHPVELAATDIMPSLQTGLINVVNATPLAALSFQWFALAKHMTDLNWAPLIGATIVSKRQWQKIPADLRVQLTEAARTTGERLKLEIRDLDRQAEGVMVQNGLVIHPLTPKAFLAWEALAEMAIRMVIADGLVSQEMADKARRLRDEYRAQQSALESGGE